MKKNTLVLFIAIFSVTTFWACGRPDGRRQKTKNKPKHATQQTIADHPSAQEDRIPVEVMPVARGNISKYLLLSSNLETEVMADVYCRIQGIVDSIFKEEGQYVKKGDIMLTLEAREYDLAEQKAHVEYEQQLKNFQRLEKMHQKNLLSDEEYEKAKYQLKAVEIAWNEAKLKLDFTKVRSPISGRVGQRLAKIGERIQPTDKLFSVVDNSQVIAVVYVPEKNMNEVKIGQKAYTTSDYFKNQKFDGWIKRISPVVDPSSGTFKVTVGVRNRKGKLRPGMFVNVHIVLDTHHNVILVPKTAVVYENENMFAYVVRDSLARKIRLQTGYEDNEKVEVPTGIEEGEPIIVVGQAGMKDLTPVRIVNVRENKLAAQ